MVDDDELKDSLEEYTPVDHNNDSHSIDSADNSDDPPDYTINFKFED